MGRAFVVVTAIIAMLLIAEVSAQDAPPAPADARVYDMSEFCPARQGSLRLMPDRALVQGISGRASLECVVNDDRRIVSCQVAEEEPRGVGFSRSALNIACAYSLRDYGRPLGERSSIHVGADGASRVRMPMVFNNENAGQAHGSITRN